MLTLCRSIRIKSAHKIKPSGLLPGYLRNPADPGIPADSDFSDGQWYGQWGGWRAVPQDTKNTPDGPVAPKMRSSVARSPSGVTRATVRGRGAISRKRATAELDPHRGGIGWARRSGLNRHRCSGHRTQNCHHRHNSPAGRVSKTF